jgi:hypothetical protein
MAVHLLPQALGYSGGERSDFWGLQSARPWDIDVELGDNPSGPARQHETRSPRRTASRTLWVTKTIATLVPCHTAPVRHAAGRG